MTDNQLTIAVAKLDGFEHVNPGHDNLDQWSFCRAHSDYNEECGFDDLLYLTSHDAIIPVIEKGFRHGVFEFDGNKFTKILFEVMAKDSCCTTLDCLRMLMATPRQLSITLLKACGKWEK